ncbi:MULTISPECIES: helix-turn-helix domain-containing protein [Anaerotruncus]|jgi:transcriptional regulator with XRE-family HTH domain|uniref:Helix-turn-helix transcriptional regulator n=1 Tax=Anaerotruncus colihominis TaxID=169435 RepID=A0A845SWG3_9FIRM|nr:MULTISPECIES: helix-turn-helix transcriptional regulator [Anaerotruncus]MCI8493138.1 helix-turn-helix transcriptional regulator [Anaerotruncus sp.]MCR2024185.1 helix-turn-helix domain-containing protein [Anaerotruncus colihominis]NDO39268.1 helix-turn-helix transcriptional regulator [Anaerotruncus colihominis]
MYREQYLFSDNIYILMGENIRTIHQRMGIKQTALAIQIDVGQKQLSLIENGKARPRLSAYLRIANALQVSINQLFAESNVTEREQTAYRNEKTTGEARQMLLQLLDMIDEMGFKKLVFMWVSSKFV